MTEKCLREIQKVRDECDAEMETRVKDWMGAAYTEPVKYSDYRGDELVILLVGRDGKPYRPK